MMLLCEKEKSLLFLEQRESLSCDKCEGDKEKEREREKEKREKENKANIIDHVVVVVDMYVCTCVRVCESQCRIDATRVGFMLHFTHTTHTHAI